MNVIKNLKPEIAEKVMDLIRNYQNTGYEVVEKIEKFDPLAILLGEDKQISISSIIWEAEEMVEAERIEKRKREIMNEIAMLEKERKSLESKSYKPNDRKIVVGNKDNFDFGVYSIGYINERRKQRMILNINSQIEELKEELKQY